MLKNNPNILKNSKKKNNEKNYRSAIITGNRQLNSLNIHLKKKKKLIFTIKCSQKYKMVYIHIKYE